MFYSKLHRAAEGQFLSNVHHRQTSRLRRQCLYIIPCSALYIKSFGAGICHSSSVIDPCEIVVDQLTLPVAMFPVLIMMCGDLHHEVRFYCEQIMEGFRVQYMTEQHITQPDRKWQTMSSGLIGATETEKVAVVVETLKS